MILESEHLSKIEFTSCENWMYLLWPSHEVATDA